MVGVTSLKRTALFLSTLLSQINAAPVHANSGAALLAEERRDVTTSTVLFTTVTTHIVESTQTRVVTELATLTEPTNTVLTTISTNSTLSTSTSASTALPVSSSKKSSSTSRKSTVETTAKTTAKSSATSTVKSSAKSTATSTGKVTATSTSKSTSSQKLTSSSLKKSTSSSKKSSSSSKKSSSSSKKSSSSSKKSSSSSKKSSSSSKKSTSSSVVTVTKTVVPTALSTALFPSSVQTTERTVKPWTSIAPKPTPTQLTTLSSGVVAPTGPASSVNPNAPHATLSLNVYNNMNKTGMHAYLTGLDVNGAFVMLGSDGAFYYPTASGGVPELITADVALPLSSGANHFTVPDYIQSARLWFSEGQLEFSAVQTANGVGLVEPTVTNVNDNSENKSWGFMELNYDSEMGLFANLSFVDFVGIPVGMSMTTDGSGTQAAPGMPSNAIEKICGMLKNQTLQDGQPWDKLCEKDKNGTIIRVLSPSSYLDIEPNAFSGYFDDYAQKVWDYYSSNPLTIATQAAAGDVSCQVSGSTLNCDGDNRGYEKPSASDIFSCNTGTFSIESGDNDVHEAVVPRLCAAFNRGTLLLPGGNVQPGLYPDKYYTSEPNNIYSMVVHKVEFNGQGYAFPYDDVTPAYNKGVAGVVSAADVKVLRVALGG